MMRIVPIIIVIMFLAGCASSSPSSKLYTLNSLVLPGQVETSTSKDGATVVSIGPVEIPDYLDRPQIVTLTPTNELFLSEFHLWGGSLKNRCYKGDYRGHFFASWIGTFHCCLVEGTRSRFLQSTD